ncbi:hypothetical protein OF83DRAFT_1173754 [Amylostereum chailletii]|nr:hypothetical protein OF83DRAFT_1173754 [Amylostereum chailletii]
MSTSIDECKDAPTEASPSMRVDASTSTNVIAEDHEDEDEEPEPAQLFTPHVVEIVPGRSGIVNAFCAECRKLARIRVCSKCFLTAAPSARKPLAETQAELSPPHRRPFLRHRKRDPYAHQASSTWASEPSSITSSSFFWDLMRADIPGIDCRTLGDGEHLPPSVLRRFVNRFARGKDPEKVTVFSINVAESAEGLLHAAIRNLELHDEGVAKQWGGMPLIDIAISSLNKLIADEEGGALGLRTERLRTNERILGGFLD